MLGDHARCRGKDACCARSPALGHPEYMSPVEVLSRIAEEAVARSGAAPQQLGPRGPVLPPVPGRKEGAMEQRPVDRLLSAMVQARSRQCFKMPGERVPVTGRRAFDRASTLSQAGQCARCKGRARRCGERGDGRWPVLLVSRAALMNRYGCDATMHG